MYLAIDPGPKQSGLAVLSLDRSLSASCHLENKCVHKQMLPIDEGVIIEQLQSYGQVMGRTILETSYWVGRFTEMACNQKLPVYLVPRILVRKQAGAGTGKLAGDPEVAAYLALRFGATAIKSMNAHCRQAYALGVIFLDLAPPFREPYRVT